MLRASRKPTTSGNSRSFRPESVKPRYDKHDNGRSSKISGSRIMMHCVLMLLVIVCVAKYAPVVLSKNSKKFSLLLRKNSNASNNGSSDPNVHIVFSTDCTGFQHWQSYLLYHSALKVNQPGKITRIASGCNDDERETLIEWHKTHVTSMSPSDEPNKFTLHLTPHFSAVKDENGNVVGDYEFFNKPFGLLHFLENYDDSADEYGISPASATQPTSTSLKLNPDDIVILLDPDMVLLRPITHDFTPSASFKPKYAAGKIPEFNTVVHGRPFGQGYGFGNAWSHLNLAQITGSASSPALKVSSKDAGVDYPVGPPYIATAGDMYKIAQKWVEFVPRTHKEHPHLLAEMYAYCIAAAHLKLPHVNIESLMVSDQSVNQEGWEFLDGISSENVCQFGASATYLAADTIAKKGEAESFLKVVPQIPKVLHLCQRYMVGEWFFGKRKMPHDYFTCESPILVTPPENLGVAYDYRVKPGEARDQHLPLSPPELKRSVFVICSVTKSLQDAAEYFKSQHCVGNGAGSETANWKKDLNLFETFY